MAYRKAAARFAVRASAYGARKYASTARRGARVGVASRGRGVYTAYKRRMVAPVRKAPARSTAWSAARRAAYRKVVAKGNPYAGAPWSKRITYPRRRTTYLDRLAQVSARDTALEERLAAKNIIGPVVRS